MYDARTLGSAITTGSSGIQRSARYNKSTGEELVTVLPCIASAAGGVALALLLAVTRSTASLVVPRLRCPLHCRAPTVLDVDGAAVEGR